MNMLFESFQSLFPHKGSLCEFGGFHPEICCLEVNIQEYAVQRVIIQEYAVQEG
jgi:hypothetical protein